MATTITNTSVATDNLTVDTNALYVDATNNRVGINTTSPQAKLEIRDDVAGEAGAFIVNSNASGYAAVRIGNPDRATNGDHLIYGASNLGLRSKTGANITFEPANNIQMTITTQGYVLMPNQPYFYAGGTTNANVSNGVFQFNDVIHNVGSHYSNTTMAFTAPVAGKYLFTCSVLNYPNAQTAGEIFFSINNSGSYYPLARDFTIPSQKSIVLSVILKLSTNDNVRVKGTLDAYYTSGHGHFSGMLLG